MTLEKLLNSFERIATIPDSLNKLRKTIQKLGAMGQLVSQDPQDEHAHILVSRVFKQRKNDRKKSLPKISSMNCRESQFILPTGWAWIPLGQIGKWATGCGFPKKYQGKEGGEYLFCKVSDMNLSGNEEEIRSTVNTIDEDEMAKIRARTNRAGTVIFPKIGGAIATNKRRILIQPTIIDNNCSGIQPIGLTDNRWLLLLLRTLDFSKYQTGTSVPAISQAALNPIRVGLPPLAEQRRIVARVDELMALCDRLEQQQREREIQHAALARASVARITKDPSPSNLQFIFHKSYDIEPADLRKIILTLAVQGKLVPQDPNDEPASKLIAHVCQERDQLLLDKKLPRINKLADPQADPFAIPNSWSWTQIGRIAHLIDYGTSQKSDRNSSNVPLFRMGDIQNGRLNKDSLKYVPPDIADLPRLYLKAGDLLFNRTNSPELVGKAGLFNDKPNTFTFASYLIRVRMPGHSIIPEYINICFQAPFYRKTQIEPGIIQQCGQANFNATKLAHTLFPIPPFQEQRRIVAKVNDLVSEVEELETQLISSRVTANYLLEAIVAEISGSHLSNNEKTYRP